MCTMVVVATTRKVSSITARASLLRMPNRMLGAVGLQLVVEGLQADPQDLRRPRLVVAVGAEGPEDQLLFRVVEAGADPERDGIGRFDHVGLDAHGRPRRRMFGGEEVAAPPEGGPLQGVPGLSHISRPGVRG